MIQWTDIWTENSNSIKNQLKVQTALKNKMETELQWHKHANNVSLTIGYKSHRNDQSFCLHHRHTITLLKDFIYVY